MFIKWHKLLKTHIIDNCIGTYISVLLKKCIFLYIVTDDRYLICIIVQKV